ncbi:MAG: hypothetical protein ACOY3K_01585 [Candidatus Omnitrophota bacterium]
MQKQDLQRTVGGKFPPAVFFLILLFAVPWGGCASLFGWKIHAPGILSEDFSRFVPPSDERVALYVLPGTSEYLSSDKGTRFSDPQTYYIGEAFVPMLIEAFQAGFSEFVLMETTPTIAMMRRYGIPHLAVVEIRGFKNRKDFGSQGLDLFTETLLFDQNLKLISRFETRGASEARKVFSKKGGPEVNLNHAIESNLQSVVKYVQETLSMRKNADAGSPS